MLPEALSRGALLLTSTATVAQAPSSLPPLRRALQGLHGHQAVLFSRHQGGAAPERGWGA